MTASAQQTKQNKTLQACVAYRIGKFTSKVSIQPAIFETLLAKNQYNDEETRDQIRALAKEGKMKEVSDVSLYIQSTLLFTLLPEAEQQQVKASGFTIGRTSIRYRNPTTEKMTKLTTMSSLVDILDALHDGKGNKIHQNYALEYCMNHKVNQSSGLSHYVRERIIYNLYASF